MDRYAVLFLQLDEIVSVKFAKSSKLFSTDEKVTLQNSNLPIPSLETVMLG